MKAIFLTILLVGTILNFQEKKKLTREGVSVEYPDHWIVRDIPGYVILISEPATDSITVMSTFDLEITESDQSLPAFCTAHEEKISKSNAIKAFVIKSKKETKFGDYAAIEYHCKAVMQYVPVEWKSILFKRENRIYKFSATSMAGRFHLLQNATDAIFESIIIE